MALGIAIWVGNQMITGSPAQPIASGLVMTAGVVFFGCLALIGWSRGEF
jgi:multisubunit Na+/H+ antiporter MnhC subunit